MTDVFMNRLLDTVLAEAAKSVEPVEEFETVAFALLATALAKLPKVRRQALLHDIETGSLREAVRKFPDRGSLGDPKGPYEHLN